MNLSIAQFTFGLGLAGQERVVVDLAKAFHDRGCRSLVCTTMYGGELVNELNSCGISFHSLGLKRSYDPRAIVPVIRFLRGEGVNVVITHGTSGSLIPRIAAILSKVPVFIHVEHNVSDHKKIYHIVLNRAMALFTDKIVCISEQARRSLMDIEKQRSDKVVVIQNGLNTGRFNSVSGANGKGGNAKKKVAIVGRFVEQKGHVYFVEAISQIIQIYKNVEFVFVGDGPLRAKIEAVVDQSDLREYCQFLGVRSDMEVLFPSFDIFVLSSLWEGLPISLLEAQYLGIASIVTNVGGNSEVIRDDYNGLLVPPRDSSALAAAILRVLNDNLLRNKYAVNGRKVIEERFSMDNMTTGYLDLIYRLSEAKAGVGINWPAK